jgi:hypothetical protein
MAVFTLKYRDTFPILEVALLEPDPATPGKFRAHDLAGSTAWKLHILLNTNVVLTRDMVKEGLDAAGVLRYAWVATDWTTGGLIAGPSLPLKPGEKEHTMEYEVIRPSSRLTFPNGGYDTLRILPDIGG